MADGDRMLLEGEDTRERYSDPMTDNFKSRIWLPRLIQILDLLVKVIQPFGSPNIIRA
jgi:hypothetical protein